jgi:DNA recombination protein RmuC
MDDLLVNAPLAAACVLCGVALGLLAGVLVCRWLSRTEMEKMRQSAEISTAVVETRLQERQQELAQQTQVIQELQHRLVMKEQELSKVLVAEASQKTTVHSLSQRAAELGDRNSTLATELATLRADSVAQLEQISRLQTSLEEQGKQSVEKLGLLEQAKDKMGAEFKAIANDIFESREQVFKQHSREQLSGLLDPLSERIKEFEQRVSDSYSQESRERFSLIREVRSLQDLNNRISKDAINLTNALKGENKTQGSWGEVILERVLEKSGLQKGREYEVQVTMINTDGRRRQPDVVVHLPEGKDVIVDAKVSLTAYEQYSSADDETVKREAIRMHIQSIRRHLKLLGEKDYQQLPGVNSLDFVLLFVPIEAAFALAVQEDASLFSDGFEKNIVIVSPSTLLTTLRTIQNIWRYEYQNRNAQEIAGRAGALYDKFVNFVGDLETIGNRVEAVQSAYQSAHNKLVSGRGSLVSRAEGMRELGAKVSKTMPKNLVEMPKRDPEVVAVPVTNSREKG